MSTRLHFNRGYFCPTMVSFNTQNALNTDWMVATDHLAHKDNLFI